MTKLSRKNLRKRRSRRSRRSLVGGMQIKLKSTLFAAEQTIELPEDATVLTLKEWVNEKWGIDVKEQIVYTSHGKELKNNILLNSNPRFLESPFILRMMRVD
jgi:hypothetical protein